MKRTIRFQRAALPLLCALLCTLFGFMLCGVSASPAGARDLAVLISAGITTADDTAYNSEYWYDMFLQYTTLIDRGYSHSDVFVLYGNGEDFQSGHPRYSNPYPGQPITDHNNRKATIQSVLAQIGQQTTSNDLIYVWWMGHGDLSGGHLIMSIHWPGGEDTVTDTEFASYMAQIPEYRLRVFAVMTCHSGGILDDLSGPASIIMTSSTDTEMSASAILCDSWHAEFHYFETCAYDWDTPFSMCGPVDADADNNSRVSFGEAFQHSRTFTRMSTPQINDVGGNAPTGYLITDPAGVIDAPRALTLRLDPARPNPMAGGTRVSFALPGSGPASLRVFGVDGRMVRTLSAGNLAAGEHLRVWDGRNDEGRAVAPGIYFLRLRAEGRELTRAVTVLH